MGMMMYLSGITQPDIEFAVHQCARFSHNPKCSHEVGIKHAARYLKGTRDKGLILSPDASKLQLDMFANVEFADFCGRR